MEVTLKKLWGYLNSPSRAYKYVLTFYPKLISDDRKYLELKYSMIFKKKLNLENPQTFNEKLNWLKLYYRQPIFTTMADKYAVKTYVEEILGDKSYIVPCYGVWNNFDDIDFNLLPDSFVLKTTHDSSGTVICKHKNELDIEAAREKLTKALRTEYFYLEREWPYKNIKPRIIAEFFLDEHTGKEVQDYKFWCFNGTPTFMYISNKGAKVYENFYDMDFCPVNIDHGFERRMPEFNKPSQFEVMKTLASKLAKDLPFIRIDFYEIEGKVYFGEFTFYDWAGMQPFPNNEWDLKLGELLKLPNKCINA